MTDSIVNKKFEFTYKCDECEDTEKVIIDNVPQDEMDSYIEPVDVRPKGWYVLEGDINVAKKETEKSFCLNNGEDVVYSSAKISTKLFCCIECAKEYMKEKVNEVLLGNSIYE